MATNQQSNKEDSDFVGLLVFLFLLAAVVAGAIYFLRPVWMHYSVIEGYLTFYTSFSHEDKMAASKMIYWMNTHSADDVTIDVFNAVRNEVLSNGMYRYIAFLISLVPLIFLQMRRNLYSGLPSMKSLLSTEWRTWPTLRFIKAFNPLTKWDEIQGPGRYAISPFTFAVENSLLTNLKSNRKSDRQLLVDKACEAFEKQVGPRFTSFSDLNGFQASLIVLISSREAGWSWDDGYKDLLDLMVRLMCSVKTPNKEMNQSLLDISQPVLDLIDGKPISARKKPAHPLLKRLVADLAKTDTVQEDILTGVQLMRSISRKHAYNTTVIAELLRTTKRSGKFPPGRVVMYRYWDRALFMLISTSPYYVSSEYAPEVFDNGMLVEAAGPMAHYQAELFAKKSVTTLHVETAVNALAEKLSKQNVIEKFVPFE